MIQTERLLLSPPRLSDVPDLFLFLGDPEAMKYTHVDTSLRQCRRRIAVHERRRRRDGIAPWTTRLQATGEIIGWGGVYEDPFDPGWGPEIGFSFHPDYHGCGLGSELAQAAIDFSDRIRKLPKLAAFAHEANTASRRLLEKIGFREIRYLPEMDRLYFERMRPGISPDKSLS